MKTRKILSTLLAFALVFSLLPTAALATSAHTAHSGSCDHEGWTKLWMDGTVLMAGDTACPDDEDYCYLTAGSYSLEGDIITDKTIMIEGEVDLCLNGHSIITSGSCGGISVTLGGTLNLYDESGNSGVITHADGVMGSAVSCNGEFNMYGGTISGNNLPDGWAGIVHVSDKFTMAGGVITGNEADGGIVLISGSGTFTMTDGTISGNKVFRDGGGVFVDYGCVFEMTGGTIENNTAGRNGSNVCIWNNGTFRLGGGTIADITYLTDGTPSGSVYIYEGGIFEKLAAPAKVSTWEGLQAALSAGGEIVLTADVTPDNPYWADPLTVYSGVTATLDLNGHIVDRGYTADMTDLYGSVFKISGTLTVTDSAPDADHGGAVAYTDPVTGNTVEVTGGVITGGFYEQSGGGVQILGGTFNLEGGSITGNGAGKNGFGAVEGLGGGVYMQSGTFNMSGGAVVGNRAVNKNTMVTDMLGKGGGVYVSDGTFTLSGGTVSGNEAGRYGGGVYLASTYSGHSGSLVSGGATVTGNAVGGADNNVYLEDGGVLSVTDTLTGTVGVTMMTPGVFTNGLPGRGTKENFISDDAGLVVSLTDAGEAQLKAEEYPLWVGGVQVTSVNKGDILNDGGTASYDPDTTTLSLNNATITATYSYQYSIDLTYQNVVHASGLALTVSLSGSNILGDGSADFAINSDNSSLTITGGGSLTASGSLWAEDGISITGSTVIATGCGLSIDSIFSREGVTITDSTVTATGSRYGITALGNLTVSGNSVVTAEGGTQAIYAFGVTLNDWLGYTEGSADAKKAVIAKPTYTVTVTPGANMMIAAGANEQTVQAGDEMERVVYLANEGYYFPEDYAVDAVNGVVVMRDSFTRITVFGTPTRNVEITLPAPTAQTREETPAATFTATGPDSGTLTNVTAGMTYAIDGGAAEEITGESVDLTGLAPCTITVIQPGNGTTTIDSEAQTITVTKAETPNLTATQPDTIGGTGSIPTTAAHEISKDGAAWTACTGEMTDLAIGTYLVRVKAAGTVLASDAQQITITDSDLVSAPTITAEPQDLALTYGYASGSLTVSAQAADGHTLSYQWYSCSSDGSGAQAISGQTGASLTIPTGMRAGETACYFCTVTATRTETGKTASADSAIASVTVGKAQLTITAVNQSYPYSGQTQGEGDTAYVDPAEIAEKITVTGLQGSDAILSIVLDGQGKDVGEYDLTPSSAQLGSAAENYEILYVPGTLTITKVKASITADDLSKVYGEADPELTAAVTGAVNGEELSYALSREAGEDVGTYAITVTLGENPNYDITAENGTLTITKAKASITADDLSKVYGEADPELTAAVTGAVNGEELSYTLSREAGEDVGTYAITVTLGENPNYDITAENGTLTITKAKASITADDLSKVYGEADPELTAAVKGAVNGEELSYTLSREAGEDVGTYAITVTLGENPNYDITAENGTLTITKAKASITADDLSKVYGEADPELTAAVKGAVNGEELSYTLSREAGEDVGTYAITVTIGENPNYDITVENGTLTINAATITITALDQRCFLGATLPRWTAASYTVTGLVNGEKLDTEPSVWYIPSSSEVTALRPKGSYQIVPYGAQAKNYEIVYVPGTLTVIYVPINQPPQPDEPDEPENPTPYVNPFTDVNPDDYFYDAVRWAVENKITSGTTSTTFSPYFDCTRAQMVTFLWRAAGSSAPKSTACPFADIEPNAYYYSAVLWAYETGITFGLTADTFGPNETVSRAQMVTFLWRNAGRPEPKSTVCPFEDIDPNAYYYKALLWAYENGITYGTTDTMFSPNDPCTRAQIVAFLYRAYNKE